MPLSVSQRRARFSVLRLGLALGLAGAAMGASRGAGAADVEHHPLAERVQRLAALEAELAAGGCPAPAGDARERAVWRAVGGELTRGLWPSPAARSLAEVLASLREHDVSPADVDWSAPARGTRDADDTLRHLLGALASAEGDDVERAYRSRLERLRATTCEGARAMVQLVLHAESTLSSSRTLHTRRAVAAARRAVAQPQQWLDELLPPHPEYRGLVTRLGRLREVHDRGGWRSWSLTERLRFEGWLPDPARSPESEALAEAPAPPHRAAEEPVGEALRGLQRAWGLEATGRLDGATRAALDVPAGYRLAQVRLALARWRSSGLTRHDTLVWVNIPAFTTELWVEGERVARYRSVVGTPRSPTPTLERRIQAVQFDPPWYVPPGVARDELAAREAASPGFLAEQGFRAARTGRGRLVQAPGPDNWLGSAILRWPAKDAIYIHGSPFTERFERPRRDLSHGCVNVEDIDDLAARLLELTGAASSGPLAGKGRPAKVWLKGGVPAVFDYIIAGADERGRLRLYPDVYDLERDELERLRAQQRTAKGEERPDASAPL